MIRVVIAAIAMVFGLSAVVAQQDAAATRQAVMKQSGKAFYATMGAMVRGQKAYDQAEVDAAFAELEAASKQYTALFPESAKASVPGSAYGVSAKAWENKADLDAKSVNSAKIVADYKGKIKDIDSLKAAYTAINVGCNGCHEPYRVKN